LYADVHPLLGQNYLHDAAQPWQIWLSKINVLGLKALRRGAIAYHEQLTTQFQQPSFSPHFDVRKKSYGTSGGAATLRRSKKGVNLQLA